MGNISVLATDESERLLNVIQKNIMFGSASKAAREILKAVLETDQGRRLVLQIENNGIIKEITVGELIEAGGNEIDFSELRQYSERTIHKDFLAYFSFLKYDLKIALYDFIKTVIAYIESLDERASFGTSKNISIYANGYHMLYINVGFTRNQVKVSRFMQFNRSDNQPENSYIWEEIKKALDLPEFPNTQTRFPLHYDLSEYGAYTMPSVVNLTDKGLIKATNHFKWLMETRKNNK